MCLLVWTLGGGYCLPIYLRCNSVFDCPRHEDEHQCDTCPGFYRCRASTVCLHATQVCDGWNQCPQHDDEQFCNLTYPSACQGQGYSYLCRNSSSLSQYLCRNSSSQYLCRNSSSLSQYLCRNSSSQYLCRNSSSLSQYREGRYLYADGSGLQPDDLAANIMLIYLNLAACNLTHFGNTPFLNLQILNMSFNHLQAFSSDDLGNFPVLTSLSLARNPIVSVFGAEDDSSSSTVFEILKLDLSSVEMKELDPSLLRLFPKLQSLNLSHCHVQHVHSPGFQVLTSLRVLDVRGCPLTNIPRTIFLGLDSLREVFADNYKVCCPAALPVGFVAEGCLAPFDEISSCDALLRSDLYRASLIVFAILATVGNVCSLALRGFVLKKEQQSSYSVFVTHLCVSDFLMGVYLVIIGAADRIYMSKYLWEDTKWRVSPACMMAGFLSLLSSEVSAAIICLITVDRFLVVQFPFSRLRFQQRSAHLACLVLWTLGTVLAAVPLLPATAAWHFYSQTGICIPLPVTRHDFPGQGYAFAVMIIFNFVLFVFIAAGQLAVYLAIQSQSRTDRNSDDRRSKDLAVAQRLFTVVVSDFLCWFPIGLLGLLASRDIPISGEVNVGMAIFVLPLNSALNPFLYSLSAVQARRTRAREEKLLRTLIEERVATK